MTIGHGNHAPMCEIAPLFYHQGRSEVYENQGQQMLSGERLVCPSPLIVAKIAFCIKWSSTSHKNVLLWIISSLHFPQCTVWSPNYSVSCM